MKLLKKILCLSATVATLFGLGLTAACDKENSNESSSSSLTSSSIADSSIASSSSSSEDSAEPAEFVYRVSLQNQTGFGFANATVSLMSGDTVVASKKTNSAGNANFTEEEISAGEYKIVVDGAPNGYALPSETKVTSSTAGTTTVITATPTGLIKEAAPSNTYYKLGDVMHDFTVTLSDGKSYTLSEVLEEKQLVVLNFWATWCTPCLSEFPAMHNAAIAYEDTVSILAISTTDSQTSVASFKKENKYEKFNMAAAGSGGLDAMFSVNNIPHTVMIDRYGVVVFNHVGSMPSVSAFTVQFDKFLGEEYISTVVGAVTEEEEEGSSSSETEKLKPTVATPQASDVKAAFASDPTASGFTFRFQELGASGEPLTEEEEKYDAYNWPWIVAEKNGVKYLEASNANVHNSYSILYSSFTANANDVIVFDYKIGSETDCDVLYLILDGVVIKEYSGYYSESWNTAYAYVFKDYEAGPHSLSFVFMKDGDTTAYDDVVQIKNLRIDKAANLENSSADINIFRHAATKLAPANSATQFVNYITPVFNEEDGYYHVGSADGEILYANLLGETPWNETSVWLLAYSNYVVGNGFNFRAAFEDFAWEATQVTDVYGYTPVTQDLKYLLDKMAQSTTYLKKWDGEYHDKEWLEVCVWWEHYGTTPLPEDPMKGITFTAAIELEVGDNTVNIPYKINPRGFKYKFTPTQSGAYKVYSTGDVNTQAFLVASDRTTELGFWDNKVFEEVIEDANGNQVSDDNFEFYWYFEAGTTYYILFATYLDVTANFNVTIERLGDNYTYLDNAALGPYSANLTTFELFLPDAIAYDYFDDTDDGVDNGYYYQVDEFGNRYTNAEGEYVGMIYLDVNRPTAFFDTAMSLYDICRQAEEYVSDPTKRALYVDGTDYTAAVKSLCFKATQDETSPTYGFVPVNKEVFELLQIITRSTKYDGIKTSWLLLCYYERYLGPTTNS